MKRFFLNYILIFSMVLALVASPLSSFAADKENVYYVSLGDSLAAGQTPFGKFGKGYPDFIAGKYQEVGVLKHFVRDYAYPGYTSKNVLDDIVNNVTKGENASIQAELSQATHITIDVGANDLLQKLKIDKEKGTVTFDQAEIQSTLLQLQKNYTDILVATKTLNPKAKIYVMGYYNPFPHLPGENQALLMQALTTLNIIIEQITLKAGATFVPTANVIGANKGFLPNPQDVHLSEDGYKAIAEEFWNVMKPEVIVGPKPTVPKPAPVVYWDGAVLKKGQMGKVVVAKPINLWKRVDGKLEFVRVLKTGEQYRVYQFDGKFGGQYGVGGGYFITKINTHVKYSTPSKAKLQLVNE